MHEELGVKAVPTMKVFRRREEVHSRNGWPAGAYRELRNAIVDAGGALLPTGMDGTPIREEPAVPALPAARAGPQLPAEAKKAQ